MNRPPAVQGSPPNGQPPPCMNPALMSAPWYHYQDEDSPPLDQGGFPRLTGEARAPELVHVSEKNLSEIENVHGYVSHSHISPLKTGLPEGGQTGALGLGGAPALQSGRQGRRPVGGHPLQRLPLQGHHLLALGLGLPGVWLLD
ncbi:hypothetical protein CRUP_031870 [Coryphaenoides rupestris]|nr:hypothetical protein CRUP_031870 [Coryphaenoides rupestris]